MTIMGVVDTKFEVPVCNSFKAKVFNGQLCYEVDIDKLKSKDNIDIIRKELKLGLGFMMDYNEDKQVQLEENMMERKIEEDLLHTFQAYEEEEASIYINTIGR